MTRVKLLHHDPFKNELSKFVYTRTYSRFLEIEGRRENWGETVLRTVNFLDKISNYRVNINDMQRIYDGIYSLEILPSMRLMWSAGACAERTNSAAYNCSYLVVDSLSAVSELMFNLLCAAGVGFSVEKKFTDNLPLVPDFTKGPLNYHTIDDSKEGWSLSMKQLISSLYKGCRVKFDYSKIRPRGAKLRTMGGTASGPEPLIKCHNLITQIITSSIGKKVRPVQWLEIMCIVADAVLVGGVRRSALIALTDLEDQECAAVKSGYDWWKEKPWLTNCNISAVYEEKPSKEVFFKEWDNIKNSGSGERGIYSRYSVRNRMSDFRRSRLSEFEISRMGTNPCAEIDLLDKSYCNLSEVVVRENDTKSSIKRKVELATIIGTIQSSLTNFNFLPNDWKANSDKERLLGVSITGILDFPELVLVEQNLVEWRKAAESTNRKYSGILEIPASSAITCVKPSGTASIVADCSPGAHSRWAKYYIRRIKIEKINPLFRMAKDQGALIEDDYSNPVDFGQLLFPCKSPDSTICRNDVNGIDQIKNWLALKKNWTHHNPSITIYLADNEWKEVGEFLYENFDLVGGLSFFPKVDPVFPQLPYEEITKEKYEELMAKMVQLDYDKLSQYEKDDSLEGSREYACVSGSCEI